MLVNRRFIITTGLSAILALSSGVPVPAIAEALSSESSSTQTEEEESQALESMSSEEAEAETEEELQEVESTSVASSSSTTDEQQVTTTGESTEEEQESNDSEASTENSSSTQSENPTEDMVLTASATSAFTFSDSAISVPSGASGYSVDGTTLTITSAGTYTVTGSCSKGAIEVKKGLSGVKLILNNLTLANDGDKAIKFKAGASSTIEIQGTNNLSTSNDKGIIKAKAVEGDDGEVAYGTGGATEGGDLTITGSGTLNMSSSYSEVVDGETEGCDAINAEGDLTVLSGTYNIDVTDDALHSDNTLTIGASGSTGPTINVTSAAEGFEGASVKLLSGNGDVNTTDDGVNAANGDITDLGWQYTIDISGGTWKVVAAGDGLDSNGNLNISGGTTEVYCTGAANGAIDIGAGEEGEINGTFAVTGGKLFAVGSDMLVTPSTGNYVLFGSGAGMAGGAPGGTPPSGGFTIQSEEEPEELSANATSVVESGKTVTIKSNGTTLYSTTAAASGSYALFAYPSMTSGATVTLTSGSTSTSGTVGSGSQQQGGQVPGGQVPGGQVPGGQQPGGQVPGGQVPGGQQPGNNGEVPVYQSDAHVSYRTHVQTYGWQGYVADGNTSGTTGQSKRLEGINIKLTDAPYSGSIQYRTHVQTYGWESEWKSDGAMSGTTGESKRLEAIQIKLTGEMAEHYDVWYRVHAQNIGWMDWAVNGDSAGTAGYSYRLEAVQIAVVPKGTTLGPTMNAFKFPVSYRAHVQTYGWQSYVKDGASCGTTGQSKRLEAINIKLSGSPYSGSIQYRTHIQTYGWESDWKSDGAQSGTTGKSKRLEAIQIKLTGELAEHYDVYYRAHVQQLGWLDWASNGASAGSAGYSYRMEDMQIMLVPKGQSAPGSTAKAFVEK